MKNFSNKNVVSVLLFCIFCLLLLGACGKSDSKETSEPKDLTNEVEAECTDGEFHEQENVEAMSEMQPPQLILDEDAFPFGDHSFMDNSIEDVTYLSNPILISDKLAVSYYTEDHQDPYVALMF